jgi:hypothetical protein
MKTAALIGDGGYTKILRATLRLLPVIILSLHIEASTNGQKAHSSSHGMVSSSMYTYAMSPEMLAVLNGVIFFKPMRQI